MAVKLLVIHFEEKRNFNNHINNILSLLQNALKLSCRLMILIRLKSFLDQRETEVLVTSFAY